MNKKVYYSAMVVIILLLFSAIYFSLDNKIRILNTQLSSLTEEQGLSITSINFIVDRIKMLPNIPTSNSPKPKQERDLEKYPLPGMFLQYLEKNGKRIRLALIEESKKIQKELPKMSIVVPPLKSESDRGLERVKEKALNDYSGDLKKMKDIVRGSQVFQNLIDLEKGFNLLKKSEVFDIEYVNNRFDNPAESGYRDLVVLLRHKESKILAELQLHLCSIINVKKKEHALYRELRTIEGEAKVQQRELTEAEQRRVEELYKKSKKNYGAAYLQAIAGEECVLQSKKYLI